MKKKQIKILELINSVKDLPLNYRLISNMNFEINADKITTVVTNGEFNTDNYSVEPFYKPISYFCDSQ